MYIKKYERIDIMKKLELSGEDFESEMYSIEELEVFNEELNKTLRELKKLDKVSKEIKVSIDDLKSKHMIESYGDELEYEINLKREKIEALKSEKALMKRFQIYLSQNQYVRLVGISTKKGISIAEIVRRVIDKEIEGGEK
jgi:hypothetical protein